MPDIVVYLLKANSSIILFYLGYRLLLRRLTFHNLNRFYLLFALLFSGWYPFVDFKSWLATQQEISTEIVYLLPNWEEVPTANVDLWPLLLVVFWMGVTWFALRFVFRLCSLWNVHRRSQPSVWRFFRYRQVFENVLPFSFWCNIYLNIHHHKDDELVQIFEHEQIHINGLHTTDVLLAELFTVFCWFNPGVWLIGHSIRENLEFITDRNVLRSGVDKKAYQYSLLRVGKLVATSPDLINSFNFKNLKRRIMMMNKSDSSRFQLGRYVFAIPAIAISVLVFTVTNANEQVSKPVNSVVAANEKTGVTSNDTTKNKVVLRNNSSKDPLYIVDGEPLARGKSIDHLNPNDIESINVLKGKSATAEYGIQGANGVILIAMKKSQGMGDRQKDSTPDSTTQAGTILKGDLLAPEAKGDGSDELEVVGRKDLLYIIDGKDASVEEFRKIPKESILEISVFKDSKSAVAKYGDKAAKGVIEVTTKKTKE